MRSSILSQFPFVAAVTAFLIAFPTGAGLSKMIAVLIWRDNNSLILGSASFIVLSIISVIFVSIARQFV